MIELNNENFNELKNHGLVLVDFYATWCGPCKMMHPIIENISNNHDDLKIIKVDVDKHEVLSREYGIMSIPTIVLFKDGSIVEKNIGFTSKDIIEDWIINHNN